MTESKHPRPATRRTVIAGLAATLGAGSASATTADPARRNVDSGPTPVDVDADNLVAGNSRFTITVEGVRGSDIETATVTVGGISFATVEVLERDPAVLAVDASNLIASESIASQDAVEVAILLAASGEEFAGTDESQVIVD